jgi:hypothetical protein
MTREEISTLFTDEELKVMGRTREEVIQSMLDEQEYENAWANRVRFTLK